MFIVLVADTDIDARGHAAPHVVGPFFTQEEATDYAYGVERFLVHVIEITSPAQAERQGVR